MKEFWEHSRGWRNSDGNRNAFENTFLNIFCNRKRYRTLLWRIETLSGSFRFVINIFLNDGTLSWRWDTFRVVLSLEFYQIELGKQSFTRNSWYNSEFQAKHSGSLCQWIELQWSHEKLKAHDNNYHQLDRNRFLNSASCDKFEVYLNVCFVEKYSQAYPVDLGSGQPATDIFPELVYQNTNGSSILTKSAFTEINRMRLILIECRENRYWRLVSIILLSEWNSLGILAKCSQMLAGRWPTFFKKMLWISTSS